MSRARHGAPRDSALVRTYGLTLGPAVFEPPPAAGWDRLIVATGTRAAVRAGGRLFPLVAGGGVWLPAGSGCLLELHERGEIRVAYVRVVRGRRRLAGVCAVALSPLLRELVTRALALGAFDGRVGRTRRLALALFDEVEDLRPQELWVPLPRHPAALEVAERIVADPALGLGIVELARAAGCSKRTLERSFALEAGLGVAAWRRRVRLLAALGALAQGDSVTGAALEAGYNGLSAFIAAFRREFGTTPGRFSKR